MAEDTIKKNLSAEAYEHIKQMILHLEIKPGEKIPEEKIAGQLGSSRTPIREALRKLSAEGYSASCMVCSRPAAQRRTRACR